MNFKRPGTEFSIQGAELRSYGGRRHPHVSSPVLRLDRRPAPCVDRTPGPRDSDCVLAGGVVAVVVVVQRVGRAARRPTFGQLHAASDVIVARRSTRQRYGRRTTLRRRRRHVEGGKAARGRRRTAPHPTVAPPRFTLLATGNETVPKISIYYVHKVDAQGGTRHLPPHRRRTRELLSGRGGYARGQTSCDLDAKRQTAVSRVSEPAVSR